MIAVGRLRYKLGNNKYDSFGSASIINFKGYLFVATAAHCVYDLVTDKMSRDVIFEYTYKGKKLEFEVSTIALPQEWLNSQLLKYDYAFGKINLPTFLIPKAFTPEFNTSLKNLWEGIHISGYQFKLFSSKFEDKQGVINSEYLNSDGLLAMKVNLNSGISGGPWFFKHEDNLKQIGVTSAKIKGFKRYIWAPIWTENTKKLLEELIVSKNDKVIFV
ncbi:hypothetical protein GH130_11755 [Staphylococcus pseudintermedius]|uniref:trypsin-like serine peptidase n=1 Tax=Staphylococcus TaxID=1279 RepID=UPI0019DBFAE5|nr:trypsin-like serine protease [Staphylococcus pseudintermedius]EGQ3940678.1 hypothetical protein [Staphylococcus pseudintermedius]MDF0070683.1 trypsin-like serine protease [Staphylococcus pseudintermedius]MDF0082666.1 trypsin-like serine protease [Staphylococcus pseudintermedius]